MEMSIKGAIASGTLFMSFYSVEEIVKIANEIGFKEILTVSTKDMTEKYFKDRTDNLVPASGEYFLVVKI
jgi:O-methyltransferase involved in polyketide biosynthesis